ncbi:TetR/AcrR family transcriptional regulator [Belliella marina]|uniref:TetR/AcrR family transcriptional regulator n=1 Tax=Belliella marina TaxID=1644146 RepID=A0ABW4VTI4_9BACT
MMRGRPVIFDNEELVIKAQQLFWEKGYNATSLTDLLKVTGAGSGSFYNTFKGGKKEVFSKAIQQRRVEFIKFRNQLGETENPIELIKDFFRSIANAHAQAHHKGCIIANTVVEMTFIDEELEAQAIQILKEVEEMFTETIRLGQRNGQIKSKTNAEVLGKYLITFWCGLNTLRRMYPDKEVLSQQIEMQLAVIS